MSAPLRLGLVLACVCLCCPASPLGAQNAIATDDEEDFLEIAPPEETLRMATLSRLLLAGSDLDRADLKSVISETALPDTSQGPIGVCFVDGNPALLEDVVSFAKAWEIVDTSIRFDFGSPANRYCQPNARQLIRISFAGKGTWSVIGLEGRLAKGATMNFSSQENWRMVSERKFRRAVQHEFGHALGLYHEHQHPDAECDSEIDWSAAGAYYRGEGFNLSDEEIERFLGVLTVPVVTGDFDPASIMIYDLPRRIFRPELFTSLDMPKCYVGRINYKISSGDIGAAMKYYPSDLVD